MDYKIVAFGLICITSTICAENHTEVEEDLLEASSEHKLSHPAINPLDKNKRQNAHVPLSFDYRKAIQQDQQRNRYLQQQKADANNLAKKQRQLRFSPLDHTTDWIGFDINRQFDGSNVEADINYKLSEHFTTPSENIHDKLLIKRQDVGPVYHENNEENVIYIKPNILKNNFGLNDETTKQILKNSEPGIKDQQIHALKSLVGQNPNIQLQGLKHLLLKTEGVAAFNNRGNNVPVININNVLPKSVTDYMNGLYQKEDLQKLQAELDEAAKTQAATVLAEAQQKAAAHVEAQHKAIAAAQEKATKAALAQIEAQNKRFGHAILPVVSHQLHYAPTHSHQAMALLQAKNAVIAQVHAQNNAILKSEARKEAGRKTHFQISKKKQREPTRKVEAAETRSSVETVESLPESYQQVVLKEQPIGYESGPLVQSRLEKEDYEDEHLYAARYAFGYRVKDYHEKNDFGHEEQREGRSAKGHYHVLLPDGRLQKVEYYADPSGYHAKVTYENVAHH